jgi:hypothetical protein
MPTIIPVSHARVIHSLTLVGDPEPMAVTYGVIYGPEVDLQAATNEMHDAMGDLVGQILPTAYVLGSTEVHARFTAGEPLSVLVHAVDRPGTGVSPVLPQNSAVLIHKRTTRAGRRGRGRIYMPGVIEGSCANNGVLDGAHRASLQNIWTAFLARFGAAGPLGDVNMVLLHNGPLLSEGDPLYEPTLVTSLFVDPVIATQRRRLR